METDEIVVDDTHTIPVAELVIRATRSGGAGGQHVNTSSTRIELLWSPATSSILTEEERQRVMSRLASRLDSSGFVRVVSSETRSQLQNRERAKTRLGQLVKSALVKPKVRRVRRPSKAAHEKRLAEKKQQSEKKSGRRRPDLE
jgi:ribosome-associated protein